LAQKTSEKKTSNFKEHSVAEFFKKNKQMLGFSGKVRSLTTIIHEYITNSLDACQEYKILPEIFVKIEEVDKLNERYKIIVKDNGPGIPKAHLGKAFGMMLAGTKFHRYVQQRGQQGIGAAGCTMYAILTTGKGIYVKSYHRGKLIRCNISTDFKTNKPLLTNVVESEIEIDENGNKHSGIEIEAEFGEIKYEKGNHGAYEYIRRTALVNPYLKIIFEDPFGNIEIFQRSTDVLPKKPKEVLPHPLGLGPHDVLELSRKENKYTKLSAFLQNRLARVSAGKINELKKILPSVNFNINPKKLEWADVEKITNAFRKIKWISPSSDGIEPIGSKLIEKSFINILNPEMVSVIERKPQIYQGGIPFIVEIGIGYGGGIREAKKTGEIMRFANRAPLMFDAGGCAITEVIKNIEWKRYALKDFGDEPVVIVVNISSVHIPYVSAGKQAIAKEEKVVEEIKNAVMKTARDIQKYLYGKRREKEREGKKKAIKKYIHQFSSDLVLLTENGDKEEIERILLELIEDKY